MDNAEGAARALMEARSNAARIPRLPEGLAPADPEGGYAIQKVHRKLLGEKLGRQIGWKIGCTNPTAQAHIGIDEPFYGGVFEKMAQASPATFAASGLFMTVIEAEIGFRLKDDLPAAAAPYDPDSVADAIDYAMPCIEIVDSRYDDWTTIGAPHIIADNGSHGAWVHGAPVADWRDHDLSEIEVLLTCNGETVREGNGFAVMGNPINPLTWLANVRAVYAREGLKAGDYISTGTTIDVYPAKAGDVLKADFGPLGAVELTIV
ncbi:MAG: 2-keto-4-pentenoate hydratase [Minwuia sp.]|uniref:2-keto-4-pentenoate hydratase n=1 Tax=Minwuia sp. TaxID=2493630 RepID=UPI003A8542B4